MANAFEQALAERGLAEAPAPEATNSEPAAAPEGVPQEEPGGPIIGGAEPGEDITIDVEGPGVLESVGDALTGLVAGPVSFIENAGDNLGYLAEKTFGIGTGAIVFEDHERNYGDDWYSVLTQKQMHARKVPDSWFGMPGVSDNNIIDPNRSTTIGGLTQSVTQFMTGFLTFRGLIGGGGTGATMGQGALTDFIGFNATDDRLSNLVQENEWLANPLTQYLAADPSDTQFEGMLKNAIEGAALGIPLDAAMALFKGVRHARSLEKAEAAKYMDEQVAPEVERLLNEKYKDMTPAEVERLVQEEQINATVARQLLRAARASDAPVDKKLLQESLEKLHAGDALTHGPYAFTSEATSAFNWSRMDSPEATQDALMATAEAMGPTINRWSKGGTYTFDRMWHDAARQLSEMVDGNIVDFQTQMRGAAMNSEDQIKFLLSGKYMVQSLAGEVDRLATQIEFGEDVQAEFLQRVSQLADLTASLKGIQRNSARVTAAGRIRTDEIADPDILKQILEDAGGKTTILAAARRIRALGGDAAAIARETRPEGFLGRATRVVNEYYINALLSGPPTHVINAASNAVKLVVMPMEKVLGGALSRDMMMAGEGGRQLMNVFGAIPEALRFGWRAFKQADNILDPNVNTMEGMQHAITMKGDSWLAHSVNFAGNVTRVPSRLLLTSDEVFKQLNYRSSLRARLQTNAFSVIPGTSKEAKAARAQWVDEKFKTGFDDSGAGIDAGAIADAQEATFTTPLKDRGRMTNAIGDLQKFANKHPILRQMLPFIRTPWNLVTDVAIRTPGLAHMSRTIRAELRSSDPRVVAKARGRLATGSLMWGAALTMSMNGKLTGPGPQDPELRKKWEESGWRPYSVVNENDDGSKTYVSYRRGDPYGTFLALAATFSELSGNMSPAENESFGAHALIATLQTLSSKTFMQGMYNVLGALAEPERRVEGAMRAHIAGYAPNLLQYGARVVEQVTGLDVADENRRYTNGPFKDVWNLLDGFQAKIPGWSEGLPAKTSWLTGKPIEYDTGTFGNESLNGMFSSQSPFIRSVQEDDKVYQELMKVGANWADPARVMGDYTLTPEEYTRYLKLIAKPSKDKRTLYDALEDTMGMDKYTKLNYLGKGYERIDGVPTKLKVLSRVVSAYKQAAKFALMREFPDGVGKAVQVQIKAAREAQRSASEADAATILETMQKDIGNR